MPSKNKVKLYGGELYYHVYNRGVGRQLIFKNAEDYATFLNLFKRYLSNEPVADSKKREYPWLHEDVQLLAYCLMPNHFHLLLYQQEPTAITRLLRGVCTAYTTYFNKKYERVGHLFQDIFKASPILADNYLLHISRYIHLNPKDYLAYPYSSLPYYVGKREAEWLQPEPILELFNGTKDYLGFLKERDAYRKSLEEIGEIRADVPASKVFPRSDLGNRGM